MIQETSSTGQQVTSDKPSLLEMRRDNLSDLIQILSRVSTPDAYLSSGLYYALTSRTRADVVKFRAFSIIVMAHPNIPGKLLTFFPFARSGQDYKKQINAMAKSRIYSSHQNEFYVARVPAAVSRELFAKKDYASLPDCELWEKAETVLDWRFPSYDVSTIALAKMSGRRLSLFRKKVKKFDSGNTKVLYLSEFHPEVAETAIMDIKEHWVETKSDEEGGLAPDVRKNLESPYDCLARMAFNRNLPMDGLFVKRGSQYIAFAIWETVEPSKTVPCIAALTASREKGLSEYLYFRTAERLTELGYSAMCIGGSETLGLDCFKRKLAPIAAHELTTIKVRLRN